MKRRFFSVLSAIGWLFITAGAAPSTVADEVSPKLELLDLDGRVVDPLEGDDARVKVFLFAAVDCPISNRYAPEARRLYETYGPRGVDFWLVYTDPRLTAESIRSHLEDFDYPFPALRDPLHTLVALTKVEITPEAAIFNADRELVYRGRIDDWYVAFGKKRSRPTVHDLERALAATLEGRAVPPPGGPAVGCFIPVLE